MYLLTNGGEQELIFISEPNLYRVIFRSNKPEAKKFQNWIFDVVLPAIRKNGHYSVEKDEPLQIEKDVYYLQALISHFTFIYGVWQTQLEPAFKDAKNLIFRNSKDENLITAYEKEDDNCRERGIF